MMTELVRVGVAGVGRLGCLHAKLYKGVQGIDLVGIYDVDAQQAHTVADENQIRAFDSYEAFLNSIDALSIAVPTVLHFDLAQQALAAGKHVFIEKPITKTVEEANQLIILADEMNRVLQVGHIERFNAAIRSLSHLSLTPMFIESHRMASFNPRGTDVAVVLDLMIHDIDIILSFVKSPLTQVDANGVAVVSNEPDIANARLQFANGCVANITASRISLKKMRKMRLFQKDTYIAIDFLQGNSEVFRLKNPSVSTEQAKTHFVLGKVGDGDSARQIIYDRLEPPEGNALKMELESFINAIKTGVPPPVTGQDGCKALDVATTIVETIKKQIYRS